MEFLTGRGVCNLEAIHVSGNGQVPFDQIMYSANKDIQNQSSVISSPGYALLGLRLQGIGIGLYSSANDVGVSGTVKVFGQRNGTA